MKLINIIIRPLREIDRIAEEEPVFSGILIFVLSVIAGNIGIVSKFFASWQTAVFHSLALVFMWAGALVLIDLIITAVIKFVNPLTSSVLNSERFRKLIIIQLNMSLILAIRPLLSLFLSNTIAWILVFIWGATIVLVSVVRLWDTTEIKAALSLAAGVLVVFAGSKILNPDLQYKYNNDFLELNNAVQKELPGAKVGLLGYSTKAEPGSSSQLISIIDGFLKKNPESVTVPYCFLIKSKVYEKTGNREKSKQMYMDLLKLDTSASVRQTALFNLKKMLDRFEYALLPVRAVPADWLTIMDMWKIPFTFSSMTEDIERVATIREIIDTLGPETAEEKITAVLDEFEHSEFIDDICFWLAEDFQKSGDYGKAVKYYKKSSESAMKTTSDRIKIESIIDYIEEKAGFLNIIEEKYMPPFAMLKAAVLYRKMGKEAEAEALFKQIVEQFPTHSAAARSLMSLASYCEEKGDFERAVEYYTKLILHYPDSIFKEQAVHKKDIIQSNIDNKLLLADYSSGWKLWQQGKYSKAIDVYRDVIEKYPYSQIAQELQYSIANYFREQGDYMRALHEYRAGYEKFKDSPRGFDFAWQAGEVLSADLNYHRRAVNWLEKIRTGYDKNYKAPISGISVLDIAWKNAEMCQSKLRDYRKAQQIYDSVVENYSDPDTAARALFKRTLIDENIYRKYSQSVSQYKKIMTRYAGTEYAAKAKKRMNDIYEKGVKLLDNYY